MILDIYCPLSNNITKENNQQYLTKLMAYFETTDYSYAYAYYEEFRTIGVKITAIDKINFFQLNDILKRHIPAYFEVDICEDIN